MYALDKLQIPGFLDLKSLGENLSQFFADMVPISFWPQPVLSNKQIFFSYLVASFYETNPLIFYFLIILVRVLLANQKP